MKSKKITISFKIFWFIQEAICSTIILFVQPLTNNNKALWFGGCHVDRQIEDTPGSERGFDDDDDGGSSTQLEVNQKKS